MTFPLKCSSLSNFAAAAQLPSLGAAKCSVPWSGQENSSFRITDPSLLKRSMHDAGRSHCNLAPSNLCTLSCFVCFWKSSPIPGRSCNWFVQLLVKKTYGVDCSLCDSKLNHEGWWVQHYTRAWLVYKSDAKNRTLRRRLCAFNTLTRGRVSHRGRVTQAQAQCPIIAITALHQTSESLLTELSSELQI